MAVKIEHSLRSKLLALMILRVVVAFVFLAVATWFQLRGSQKVLSIYPLYAIVAVIGFLTILYAIVIMRIERLVFFGYIQSAADIAVITVIVYATGGIDSYLSILYHLSVIGKRGDTRQEGRLLLRLSCHHSVHFLF